MSNLIKDGEKYYHNKLRLLPPNPKCSFDDDGNPVMVIEPFSIQYRKSLTEKQVLNRLVQSLHLEVANEKKEIGAIKYMANEVGLDVLCFAIDACEDDIFDNNISRLENAIDLEKYFVVARQRLRTKIAEEEAYIKDTAPPSIEDDYSLEDQQKEWLDKLINGNKGQS